MPEFVDTILQKRILVVDGSFLIINLLLISLMASLLQAHRVRIMAHIQAPATNQAVQETYTSSNEVTNALSMMAAGTGRAANMLEIRTLSGIMSASDGVTHADRAVGRGFYVATTASSHAVTASVGLTVRTIGDSISFTGRTIISSFMLTGRGIGETFLFADHTIGDSFSLTGHAAGSALGFFSGLSDASSVIRPADPTPTPIITQIRARQAAIIQSGTIGVSVPSLSASVGTGGACDNGEGNGGYPLSWCSAAMDTVSTVPYSNDPINRECTSYAYWYFTSVEGFTNFRAWGNAKYWASTSNYPTHATPAVGAIAVETSGAYGHVAIVQALPGQKYAGQTVPAGYVLVSEMNYDWNGHFRYSYSPLTKFSAYIYPAP